MVELQQTAEIVASNPTPNSSHLLDWQGSTLRAAQCKTIMKTHNGRTLTFKTQHAVRTLGIRTYQESAGFLTECQKYRTADHDLHLYHILPECYVA